MKELRTQLIKIRVDNAMNQAQFAKKIGVSFSYVSKVENGERDASIHYLKKIAKAFGISYGELIRNSKHTIVNIRDRILAFREKTNMSQTEFAEAIKMSTTSVSCFEAGERYPTPKALKQILNYIDNYGVVLDDFEQQYEELSKKQKQLTAALHNIVREKEKSTNVEALQMVIEIQQLLIYHS